MLQSRRQRKGAKRTTLRLTTLYGPEPLEQRTLLNATSAATALQLPAVTVSSTQYSSTDILVQFKPGVKPSSVLAGTSVGQQMGLVKGLYEINLSGGVTVASALAAYQKSPNVLLAEADRYLSTSTVPNDPYFNQQWDLNNTGQAGGTPGDDIHAEQAWNVTTGGTPITVAVMDTGIDYNHPDLYQSLWINQAEIPQSRLQNLTDVYHDGYISWRDLNASINQGPGKIEDYNHDGHIDAADILTPMVLDSNGKDTGTGGWAYPNNTQDGDTNHPNDFFGWNFVANNNNPFDQNGHGTFVSGEIAAPGNNGVGIAGVDWNAQLMPVQFLDSNGSGTISDFISGLNYAVAHGAKISNNSWQGATNDPALYQAIQNAQNSGMIFVVAAGNNGIDTDTNPQYPANFQLNNVVSVAATDANDQLASFSNYGGNSISLAAPGVNIESTEPQNSYGQLSGTSMSTPLVSGAMALVWSIHPSWSYQQVINQVLSTVDKVPGLSGKVISGGVLDLAAAVGGNTSSGTPPAIVNSYPTGTSGTVSQVVVVFNEAVDPSTFGTGNATLTLPNGSSISPSSVSVQSSSGNKVFFITVPTQTQGGTYGLHVSGVRDTQGDVMQDYRTTFQCAGQSSNNGGGSPTGTPPAIINSYPTGTSGTVSQVVVVFNEAVDPSTFGTGNATLTLPNGSSISPSSVSVQSSSGNKVFFITVPTQTQGGTYGLHVSGVRDTQGDVMQDYRTTFQCAGQSSNNGGGSPTGTPPAIINSYPTGTSGTISQVVVVFNEAVDPSTFGIGNATLTLPNGSSVSPSSVSVQSSSGNKVFFITVPTQTQGGTYGLHVSGVRDTQGDVMQDYRTTFQCAGSSSTASIQTTSSFTTSTAVAIPAYGPVASSLTVNQNLTIGHVQVKVNLQYPQDGQLYIHLVAPDGTYLVLSNRRGGNGQNFTNTLFDSSAGTSIAQAAAPFTGTFAPEDSLNYLNGKNAAGTWKLWVTDLSGTYTGTINNWSLIITPKS